jgi:hypothetical protein
MVCIDSARGISVNFCVKNMLKEWCLRIILLPLHPEKPKREFITQFGAGKKIIFAENE